MTREKLLEILKIADALKASYTIKSESLKDVIKAIENDSTAGKTGYWFVDERPEGNREVICSKCEQPIFKYHKLEFDYRPNYCPNCGAKMIEPQESEG